MTAGETKAQQGEGEGAEAMVDSRKWDVWAVEAEDCHSFTYALIHSPVHRRQWDLWIGHSALSTR